MPDGSATSQPSKLAAKTTHTTTQQHPPRRNWLAPRRLLSQQSNPTTSRRLAALLPRSLSVPKPPQQPSPDIHVEIHPRAAVPVIVARTPPPSAFKTHHTNNTTTASSSLSSSSPNPSCPSCPSSNSSTSANNVTRIAGPAVDLGGLEEEHFNDHVDIDAEGETDTEAFLDQHSSPLKVRRSRFSLSARPSDMHTRGSAPFAHSQQRSRTSFANSRPSISILRRSTKAGRPHSPPSTDPSHTHSVSLANRLRRLRLRFFTSFRRRADPPPTSSDYPTPTLKSDVRSMLPRNISCDSTREVSSHQTSDYHHHYDCQVGKPRTETTVDESSANTCTSDSSPPSSLRTIFGRAVPPHILQGSATFQPNAWNDYRERIDLLAHDDRFMHFLTAPVSDRVSAMKSSTVPLSSMSSSSSSSASAKCRQKLSKMSNPHPPQLAVNKLYPLAFIRLLEAHAKHAADSESPVQSPSRDHSAHFPNLNADFDFDFDFQASPLGRDDSSPTRRHSVHTTNLRDPLKTSQGHVRASADIIRLIGGGRNRRQRHRLQRLGNQR